MKITPLLLGSGNAGKAITQSLAIVAVSDPRLELEPVVRLERGSTLSTLVGKYENPALFIANPHGLHAKALLEAGEAGFCALFCEKPCGVTPEEVGRLSELKSTVAVFHGYRQMWGPQTLKRMVDRGECGDLISIEGRYWQASAAERALSQTGACSPNDWKNNPELSGPYDTVLDLGTHWLDLACFLSSSFPSKVDVWRSFVNAPAPHRDCHVQMILQFPTGTRAFSSISKTVHGATNDLEVIVLGSRRSASWNFLRPDEIQVGTGRDRAIVTRKPWEPGSLQSPHHGQGWLEGYIDICRQGLLEFFFEEKGNFPRLEENVRLLQCLFAAASAE